MLSFIVKWLSRAAGSGVIAAFMLLGISQPSSAEFPDRTMKLIVGFGAGVGSDLVSRILADGVGEALHQPMIVENKPGAAGTIAAALVAKSAPDGYTTTLASAGALVINPRLMKLTYDRKAFEAITLVGQGPLVVMVRADSPLKTLDDLISAAKAKPNGVTYATVGIGTTNHLAALAFEVAAGIKMQHVPYVGASANTDLLAGRIDWVMQAVTTASLYTKDGRARALAVTTGKRSAMLPDVPTIAELGFPDYDISNWYAILAPKGTPRAVIGKLQSAFVATINKPQNQEKLKNMGLEPVGSTSEDLEKFLVGEDARHGATIKASNLKLE